MGYRDGKKYKRKVRSSGETGMLNYMYCTINLTNGGNCYNQVLWIGNGKTILAHEVPACNGWMNHIDLSDWYFMA